MKRWNDTDNERWFKITQWMLLLTVFLCVGVAFITRKPLCINSKTVESLDRVGGAQLAQIWSCQKQKKVPFDAQLWKAKDWIEKRLHKVETRVQFLKPVTIIIRDDRPQFFKVSSQSLELGAEIIKEPTILERALFKAWIKQVSLPQQDLLTEEVLADLLVYTHFGYSEFSNKESMMWPNVVKSGGGYCASEWMSLEHRQFCSLAVTQEASKMTNFTDLSLRPLLTRSLTEAYRKLSVREQIGFPQWIFEFLKSGKTKSVQAIGSYAALSERVIGFSDRVRNSSPVGEKLQASMNRDLERRGFEFEETKSLSIDMAYLVSGRLESQAAFFSDMVDFSKQEPKKRLAIIDEDYIWLLPSLHPLKRSLFPKIHVKNALSQFCGWPNLSDLENLKNLADRVLTVNSCQRTSIRVSGFASEGAEAFARQNPKLSFAQFHLPSVALLNEISGQGLKNFKMISPETKGVAFLPQLGHRNSEWVDGIKAFKVHSAIDAIEWYRF